MHLPIFFPVGDDELYALDTGGFEMISLKPLWPPRLERENHHCHYGEEWTWHCLPAPPFDRMDVASYALHPDGRTILVSTTAPEFIADPFSVTDDGDDDGGATAATFAFDTKGNDNNAWARHGEWTMPFVGRAHFVHGLNASSGSPMTWTPRATSAPARAPSSPAAAAAAAAAAVFLR
nr:unnamed protein product [Digitaria exilis]